MTIVKNPRLFSVLTASAAPFNSRTSAGRAQFGTSSMSVLSRSRNTAAFPRGPLTKQFLLDDLANDVTQGHVHLLHSRRVIRLHGQRDIAETCEAPFRSTQPDDGCSFFPCRERPLDDIHGFSTGADSEDDVSFLNQALDSPLED